MMISQGLQVTKQAPILRDLSDGRVSEAMSPPPAPIPADAHLAARPRDASPRGSLDGVPGRRRSRDA